MKSFKEKYPGYLTCSLLGAVWGGIGLIFAIVPYAFAADEGQDTVNESGCMQTLAGFGLNCTANDISIARVSNLEITDQCDFPGDTTTFTANFEIKLTAQARHDIGIYFDTKGDPENDGALTGICTVSSLNYKTNPPWLDLDGTTNPFVGMHKASGIQDTCGDIDANHNPLNPRIRVENALCVDKNNDTWLDLPYCTSWRQPGDNELCTGALATQFSGGWSSGVVPGAPSKCKCDLSFQVPVLVPKYDLRVEKIASPGTIAEPGGLITYTVKVYNDAPSSFIYDITLEALIDSRYRDLSTTNCLTSDGKTALGYVIPPQGYFQCQFTAMEEGNPQTIPDTVTAWGVDTYENEVSGDADAQVEITNVNPTITVIKDVDLRQVNEPGGMVTFTVKITNTSTALDPVTLTSIVDDLYGSISGSDCAVGTTLASGASCSITFSRDILGNANTYQTDTVTVKGVDDEYPNPEYEAMASDDATVNIIDVPSSILLKKVANPTLVKEPGDYVTFTFTVTNTSAVDALTIESLYDDQIVNLVGDDDCKVGTVLLAGQSCEFAVSHYVAGNYKDVKSVKDTATVAARDDDMKPEDPSLVSTATATVNIENVPPSAALTKKVQGVCATYEVTVTNTSSAEDLELTALVDDPYGDILDPANTLIQYTDCAKMTILQGDAVSCLFEACSATSYTTDTVTATVSDDEGGQVQPQGSATVTFEPAVPPVP